MANSSVVAREKGLPTFHFCGGCDVQEARKERAETSIKFDARKTAI